jgi:hypothetical protein
MTTWSSPNQIIDLAYYQTLGGYQLDKLNQKLRTLGIPILSATSDWCMSNHVMISSLLLNIGASQFDLARLCRWLWLGEAARYSRCGS